MRPILLTVLNVLILTMQVTFHDRLKIQISSIKLRNFSSFLHKYGLYIILLHLKQKKGWKMVARDCFVKQETPSIQIPKFYLNSLHKDTSFKKISQFVNAETILISLYLARAMINPDARCQCWLKIHIVSWSRFSQVGSKLGIN